MNTLAIRSIDIMKLTKDTVNNQQTKAQIDSAVAQIKAANATHAAISVPMNSNTEMQANGNKPTTPIEQYTQMICDSIHSAGLAVLFRGTYCECEGIYNFPFHQDTQAYWLNKVRTYIESNAGFFHDGDIFAPFPESTNVISGHPFGTIFLAMPNGTSDYANFFKALHALENTEFAKLNKKVQGGLSTNNYSEIESGYIPQGLFDDAGMICIDDYETPATLDQHLRDVFQKKGGKLPVFQQEWGMDYTPTDPIAEMQSFCDTTAKRVTDGVQAGLNYWGGWTGALESIFDDDGKGGYKLNAKGQVIQKFYGTFTTPTQTPQPPTGAFSKKAETQINYDGKGTLTITLTNLS